jgi:SPP1 family predicted phage head-tail adaptor
MAAGPLRDRISFYTKSQAADGRGGFDRTLVLRCTVWGSFTPARSRERVEAGRLESAVDGVMRIRSSSDTRSITADWIARLDGVDYNIIAVMNADRRDRFITLEVRRGVAT